MIYAYVKGMARNEIALLVTLIISLIQTVSAQCNNILPIINNKIP